MTRRVAALFGRDAIGADGKPDRPAIARIVFADKAALAALEAELHPRVQARRQAIMATEPHARWAVEIPLLFEKNLDADFDLTVCVHCSPRTQLARLEARGLPPEQAFARMKAQLPVEEKVRRATLAAFNEGDPAFLEAQQADLLSRRTAI